MNGLTRLKYIQKVCLSYAVDILLSGFLFIPAVLGPWTKPYERAIDVTDPRIALPYDSFEMFPPWSLPVFITILGDELLIILACLLRHPCCIYPYLPGH
jgi:hypothetical protein